MLFSKPHLNVLLVDTHDQTFALIRKLLKSAPLNDYKLSWAREYNTALRKMTSKSYDAYIIEGELNGLGHTGIDLIREVSMNGLRRPIILLVTSADSPTIQRGISVGAAEYFVKSEMTPDGLERAIRYAIDRKDMDAKYDMAIDYNVEQIQSDITEKTKAACKQAMDVTKMLETKKFSLHPQKGTS